MTGLHLVDTPPAADDLRDHIHIAEHAVFNMAARLSEAVLADSFDAPALADLVRVQLATLRRLRRLLAVEHG